MADVFVSYSRKNSDFAKRLVSALEVDKHDVWVDWEDIPLSSNWWGEICEGIEAADSFVFIMSPDSIASPICNFEIAHAIRYNKRIIPIVRQEVDEKLAFASLLTADLNQSTQEILGERDLMSVARQSWGALARHNWLIFDDESQFDAQFKKLLENLHTDLQYVKSHTRFLQRAIEWDNNQRNTSFLLTGDEIAAAETWLSDSQGKEPEPTNLHYSFVTESRKSENEQIAREQQLAKRARNAIIGVFGVILVASIGLALIFAQNNATLQAEAATLQAIASTSEYQGNYVQSQIDYAATRQFFLSPLDITQTPALDFFATATAYTVDNFEWEVVSEIIGDVEMVLVPAGCFFMGQYFPHEICFEEPFWIDRYEVTNEQYGSVSEGGNCSQYSSEPNQPRNCVNWFDASDYCANRGENVRLPSEAEWEYAARGSNSLTYPWGNEFIADNVVYSGNSGSQTANVGSRPDGASWVGAEDMSGNLEEWTRSISDGYPYDATDGRENSENPKPNRVLRGGSFQGASGNMPSANRNYYVAPDNISNYYGFRCVLSVPIQN